MSPLPVILLLFVLKSILQNWPEPRLLCSRHIYSILFYCTAANSLISVLQQHLSAQIKAQCVIVSAESITRFYIRHTHTHTQKVWL